MTMLVITLIIVIVATGVVVYNRLINARNRVDTAWSDIDVQLQRRHDLIPNLVCRSDAKDRYRGSWHRGE